jgi:hypothetical protein
MRRDAPDLCRCAVRSVDVDIAAGSSSRGDIETATGGAGWRERLAAAVAKKLLKYAQNCPLND